MKYKVTKKPGEKIIGWIGLSFFMMFELAHLALIIAGDSFGIAFDLTVQLGLMFFVGLSILVIYKGGRPKVLVENNSLTYYAPFKKAISLQISDICSRRTSVLSNTEATMFAGTYGGLLFASISAAISKKSNPPMKYIYQISNGEIISINSQMKNADILNQAVVEHLKMTGGLENKTNFFPTFHNKTDEDPNDNIEQRFVGEVEAERYIKKIYKPKIQTRLIQIFFFCLFAGVLYLGFFYNPDETSNSIKFDNNTLDDSQCFYTDVVGISDWIIKKGEVTYYLAMNSEQEYFIVRLNENTYEKLKEQRDYFYGTISTIPDAVRIYGSGQVIEDELNADLQEVLGVTEMELWRLCGMAYFDDVLPFEEERGVYQGISLMLGLLVIIIIKAMIQKNVILKKSIKKLIKDNLIIAASNEAYTKKELWKNREDGVVLTKTFVFSATGYIIPVSEILWCYVKTSNTGKSGNGSVIISTHDMKERAIVNYPASSGRAHFLQHNIASRNPAALIGYSIENKSKYEQIVNER